MHADIIVAGEGATFGQPEVRVGVMPGAGGTQRLTRAIGKFRAMLICMTGQTFSGREAFDMGLASKVVPDAEVLDTALAIARSIAAMPPPAIQQIKEVLLAGEIGRAHVWRPGRGGRRFGPREGRVGVMPGPGGTQGLTRAIGKFRAMLICMTGQTVSGREAFDMGLASKVVPDAEVLDTALAIARSIAAMPPLAIQQIKEVLLAGEDAPLETALMLERKA